MHALDGMSALQSPPELLPTTELVKQALGEARGLVELEVRIAKDELRAEMMEAKRAAIAGTLAIGSAMLVLAALMVAVIFALGGTVGAALAVAAALAVLAVASVAVAYAMAPKSMLKKTRQQLKNDADALKEHVG
jgi:uncharacterized membrane protein YqjE